MFSMEGMNYLTYITTAFLLGLILGMSKKNRL